MLNDDILYLIFQYLNAISLRKCLQINRQWRTVALYDGLWKKLYNREHTKHIGKLSNEKTWFEIYKNYELNIFKERFRLANYLQQHNLSSVPALKITSPGNMPIQIGYLSNLQHLCWNSGLTILPREIGLLTGLRTLELDKNKITSIPAEVYFLTNLRILSLSRNRLTLIPKEIAKLINLRELNLSHNLLTSISQEICCLTNLQTLNLAINELTTIPPDIHQMRELKSIMCDAGSIPFKFCKMPNLKIKTRTIEADMQDGDYFFVKIIQITKNDERMDARIESIIIS